MTGWLSGNLSVWSLVWHRLIVELWLQLQAVTAASYWHTFGQGLSFVIVFLLLLAPGLALWQALTSRILWRDLPAVTALVLLLLFFWQYLITALNLPLFIFWIGIGGWVLIGGWRGGWAGLKRLRQSFQVKYLGLFLLLAFSALAWIRPTLLVGQHNPEREVLVSPGERLLFLGYDAGIARSLPPQHAYWAEVPLAYHYFGMVEQVAWQNFGFDPLLLNYIFLPLLMALVVGGLIAVLSVSLSPQPVAWWLAPLIFFWWDTALAIMPASLHLPGSLSVRWWHGPYQGHAHPYMNGPSHHFGTAFFLFLWYLASLLSLPRSRKYWLALLLGVTAASLILFKVQTFLIVTLLGGLVAIIVGATALIRRRLTLGLRLAAIASLAFVLVTGLFIIHNRPVLLEGGSGNISFRPFQEVIGLEINNLPALQLWYQRMTGIPYQQLSAPTDYLGNTRSIIALSLLTLLSLGVTLFVKLIGIAAPNGTDQPKRWLILTMKAAVVIGLGLMYSLAMGGSNQWQFLYPVLALLSVLTALTLASWRYTLVWVIIASLLAMPTALGMLAMFSERQLTGIPADYLSTVSAMVPPAKRKTATCLFLLPQETPINSNQPLELILPFYARCLAAGTFGPQTYLNTRPVDMGKVGTLWDRYNRANDNQSIIAVMAELQPDYIWLAPKNRYGLTEPELEAAGWRQQYSPRFTAGTVWARE